MPFSREKNVKVPRKAKSSDLPKTEKEWVKYVEDLHFNGIANRRKHEFQWILNIAYYLGYQDLRFDRQTQNIQLPKAPERPLTINRIGSFIDARLAKLTKNKDYSSPTQYPQQ